MRGRFKAQNCSASFCNVGNLSAKFERSVFEITVGMGQTDRRTDRRTGVTRLLLGEGRIIRVTYIENT